MVPVRASLKRRLRAIISAAVEGDALGHDCLHFRDAMKWCAFKKCGLSRPKVRLCVECSSRRLRTPRSLTRPYTIHLKPHDILTVAFEAPDSADVLVRNNAADQCLVGTRSAFACSCKITSVGGARTPVTDRHCEMYRGDSVGDASADTEPPTMTVAVFHGDGQAFTRAHISDRYRRGVRGIA